MDELLKLLRELNPDSKKNASLPVVGKLEVGETYETRSGCDKVFIAARLSDMGLKAPECAEVVGVITSRQCLPMAYYADGRLLDVDGSPHDLVRKATAPKQEFVPGNLYRTKLNFKARCVGSNSDGNIVFECMNDMPRTSDNLIIMAPDGKTITANNGWDVVGPWDDKKPAK